MKYRKEGADAFEAGKDSDDNPYVTNSYPWRCWDAGWHDAWFKLNY